MSAAVTPVPWRRSARRCGAMAAPPMTRACVLARSDDLKTAFALRRRNWTEASAVRGVELEVAGDLPLPAVAVREQPLLVVVELLAGLDGELDVRSLDD